jgi:hypothetical protein
MKMSERSALSVVQKSKPDVREIPHVTIPVLEVTTSNLFNTKTRRPKMTDDVNTERVRAHHCAALESKQDMLLSSNAAKKNLFLLNHSNTIGMAILSILGHCIVYV